MPGYPQDEHQLQKDQEAIAARIEEQVLGGQRLNVVYENNLTLMGETGLNLSGMGNATGPDNGSMYYEDLQCLRHRY